ncbi:hypothetical protein M404DRAFT_8565 [Pisolithus tinctorius Marx 270]|uniref:Uncharacterized protein n=1 Tax=Pisolithus tinctorius Marx 270 TaxID=870435 RepID=A0A0C3PF59_PISTI|nr:hypothetical protein M404DRAFT_8565 [Pisolithus tinctorius Marx 270]
MYWDQHASGEKAVKVQEEEWVAEDARYKRMGKSGSQAEGKRREHEHPDAILDQSRRILEGQQFALTGVICRDRGAGPIASRWRGKDDSKVANMHEQEDSVDDTADSIPPGETEQMESVHEPSALDCPSTPTVHQSQLLLLESVHAHLLRMHLDKQVQVPLYSLNRTRRLVARQQDRTSPSFVRSASLHSNDLNDIVLDEMGLGTQSGRNVMYEKRLGNPFKRSRHLRTTSYHCADEPTPKLGDGI